MRRRVPSIRLGGALVLLVGAALAAGGGGAGAASSTTVVSVTVPSASQLNATGCQTGMANVTSFGSVLPGSAAVTSSDCVVKFGSSNDSAMLKLYQADGVGTAMTRDVWYPVTSTVGSNGNAVAAVGDQVAYVAGNGMIFRTANAGSAWTSYNAAALGVNQSMYDITAIDADSVWSVGASGAITKTVNGGTGWTAQTTGAAHLYGVDAVDTSTAWAVGAGGVVLATTNGTAWNAQTSNTAQTLLEVDAVSASVAWATGNGGTVIRTTDGGTTWIVRTAPSGSNVRTIHAIDANRAFVGAADGKFYRTIDGGTSWTTALDVTGSTNAHDITGTPDGSVLWALADLRIGGNVIVHRSIDGGATWTSQAFAGTQTVRGIGAGSASTAYIVGDTGVAYRTPQSSAPDYSAGVDWSSAGPAFFGACLSSATSGATTGATTWTPSAGCPSSDGAWWKPVVVSSATAGSKVAEALAIDDDTVPDATANLRFVFHAASNTPPGTYSAPLVFETVAPNAAS